MSTENWDLFGKALLNHFHEKGPEYITIHYADGDHVDMPLDIFFRAEEDLPELETTALVLCHGHILDVGAGSGCHSLVLQSLNQNVTGLEISPSACDLMKLRGVKKVLCEDIFQLTNQKFDTILMLMNGIGCVKTLEGLREFLHLAKSLLNKYGQILLDSSDMQNNELESIFGETYFGETTLQMEYEGKKTEIMPWLYVDPETLNNVADECGWNTEIITTGEEGAFLAQLTASSEL